MASFEIHWREGGASRHDRHHAGDEEKPADDQGQQHPANGVGDGLTDDEESADE